MEIEQLAEERPDAVAKVEIVPGVGVDLAKATEILLAGGFPADIADQVAPTVVKLYEVYEGEDATLVREIVSAL